ncbi:MULTISPECIES: aminotransferase class III-fold pyridoxal phosphate-dependent enzyme [Clostridia]|uniref:aminotransferase class III-fold pyridoxal phosphate-dependent enzyme n=1 Tax=Clostridia TaxID=186801 RepID=UPI000EA06498|nr:MULTISPECIES: aminotransferase class III-fold pyridoxal phosphate-dependent enzyme [Clostridia]NBJ69340.1 aminotransferase class III-fold pyridoxal phosphate-dependent enzyme [Roseburia sp. 1XD42-34]RKI79007.1 aminotransferase class III-fold pyridoxal phosphate-dependent enzyme [Clostridium sp. 1xD42-85]
MKVHYSDKVSQVWPLFTNVAVDYGKGVHLYDRLGREFIDFTSGIGVTNTGHCHPRIVNAIKEQSEKLLHGQTTILYNSMLDQLSYSIQKILPEELNCFFFSNSGSEAVESAIKLVRHATGKPNIICFQGGYHGRSIGALSLTTAKSVYRSGYQPLMPGVFVSPYPYFKQYQEEDTEKRTKQCLDELEHLLNSQSSPSETAAMIIEPVLGEGGYVPPSKEFMKGVRELCNKHDILLIFDEIQTGFGRTGEYFAFKHFDVVPDILVIAKGIASGLPLSGIVANKKLMDKWIPGSHGGTYGPNPLSMAAAIETIKVLEEEDLINNSKQMGSYLLSGLEKFKNEYPEIVDVRGKGLMVGCEFVNENGSPGSLIAEEVRKESLAQGLILLMCGPYNQVIRWIPPLTVKKSDIDKALTIFGSALKNSLGRKNEL